MRIEITDEYILTSDAYNVIVNERGIVQEGKNRGKEVLKPVGYYPCLIQAIEGVLTKKMRRSTKRTLQTLVREHTELLTHIKGLFGLQFG
jgi:hypothetical protein